MPCTLYYYTFFTADIQLFSYKNPYLSLQTGIETFTKFPFARYQQITLIGSYPTTIHPASTMLATTPASVETSAPASVQRVFVILTAMKYMDIV